MGISPNPLWWGMVFRNQDTQDMGPTCVLCSWGVSTLLADKAKIYVCYGLNICAPPLNLYVEMLTTR